MEINLGTLKMPIMTEIKTKNPVNIKRGKNNRAAGKAFELKIREDLEKSGWIVMRNTNDVEFMEGVITKISGDYSNIIKETDKITNTPYKDGIFKQAKPKWVFNPMLKRRVPISSQTGFPDFVCVKVNYKDKFISEIIEFAKKEYLLDLERTKENIKKAEEFEKIIPEQQEKINLLKIPHWKTEQECIEYALKENTILKIGTFYQVQFVECKTNGTLDKVEREKIEWIKNNLKIPVFVASKIKIGRKVEVKYERI